MTEHDAAFVALRPTLLGVAYRMLGSATEAEDVVQDAYLRWSRVDPASVGSARALLVTTVTRLCIDRGESARARREQYHGPWLPEPVAVDDADPAAAAELADSLSMAFLVLLEELGPVERAAFLLHDVFGYGYDEVADMTSQSRQNARQLVSRSRRRIEERRRRFDADAEQGAELARRFMVACATGDMDSLMSLMTDDVVVWTDGGGVARAAPRPVLGPYRAARFLVHVAQGIAEGSTVEPMRVNGQPGLAIATGGVVNAVVALDVLDGLIGGVRVVVNPAKLGAVQPGAGRFPAVP